jgi:hypothetical protein
MLLQQQNQYQKIIERNGLTFIKLTPNKFNLTFDINNRNILLPSIINFELIQLIYKLNPTVFEYIETEKEPEKEPNTNAIMNILLKDLFSDLGLPQYYLALNITQKGLDTNKIVFNCELIDNKLLIYPNNVELLQIQNINIQFDIINNHSVKINCDIDLMDKHNIPSFSEKMIGNIIYNIFNRLKQFIEKVSF